MTEHTQALKDCETARPEDQRAASLQAQKSPLTPFNPRPAAESTPSASSIQNLEVVHSICSLLDELVPDPLQGGHRSLIRFVQDRPGHDLRYAINATKVRSELGWEPTETFESGLVKTVSWYLQNAPWCERVLSGKYRGERLGLFSESI